MTMRMGRFATIYCPSFLAVDGAKEVGIELNTLSKSHNMAGYALAGRLGIKM